MTNKPKKPAAAPAASSPAAIIDARIASAAFYLGRAKELTMAAVHQYPHPPSTSLVATAIIQADEALEVALKRMNDTYGIAGLRRRQERFKQGNHHEGF
jgi:hypothetical protein